jgi:hypothetical protein
MVSRSPPRFYHQLEYSLISIEPVFLFPVPLIELLNLDRELRRLLEDKVHCALSFFFLLSFFFRHGDYDLPLRRSLRMWIKASSRLSV